jgi:hypothetical protein
MLPSACPPWQTDSLGQTARERNEAAASYTTTGGTIVVAILTDEPDRSSGMRNGQRGSRANLQDRRGRSEHQDLVTFSETLM